MRNSTTTAAQTPANANRSTTQLAHCDSASPCAKSANRTIRPLKAALIALACLLVPLSAADTAQAGKLFDYLWSPTTLQSVKDGITKRYSDIDHMTTDQLAKQIDDGSDIVLIDVRDETEYRVSHLNNAILAPPGASLDHVQTQVPVDIKGKTVVFYCSVGERSSRMAQRMKDALMAQGAHQVYNLNGGIFAWHNEKRQLVNDGGQTDFVHPFDKQWGRLVDRNEMTAMTPKPQTTPNQTAP